MKSKFRYLIIGSLFLAVCLMLTGVSASSVGLVKAASQQEKKDDQKAQTIELKGQRVTSRGGDTDPNIKSDSQVNDPNAQIEAPPSKGGPRPRGGGSCEVRLDNRTRYYIKIYVDGRYRGTIGPYGDAVVHALPGETRVYARADFTGTTSYLYWGPRRYDCGSSQYIYFKMT
jgi:hypothetical protein